MIVCTLMGVKRNFKGQSFWARGYFVSTVGLDEVTIREYIRKQEKTDKDFDQLTIFYSDDDGEKQTSPSGDS